MNIYHARPPLRRCTTPPYTPYADRTHRTQSFACNSLGNRAAVAPWVHHRVSFFFFFFVSFPGWAPGCGRSKNLFRGCMQLKFANGLTGGQKTPGWPRVPEYTVLRSAQRPLALSGQAGLREIRDSSARSRRGRDKREAWTSTSGSAHLGRRAWGRRGTLPATCVDGLLLFSFLEAPLHFNNGVE